MTPNAGLKSDLDVLGYTAFNWEYTFAIVAVIPSWEQNCVAPEP